MKISKRCTPPICTCLYDVCAIMVSQGVLLIFRTSFKFFFVGALIFFFILIIELLIEQISFWINRGASFTNFCFQSSQEIFHFLAISASESQCASHNTFKLRHQKITNKKTMKECHKSTAELDERTSESASLGTQYTTVPRSCITSIKMERVRTTIHTIGKKFWTQSRTSSF